MATSYMEMIFVSKDGKSAYQTGVRAALKTNAETWVHFKKCRHFEVTERRGNFLLDYDNAKGDLAGTIRLSAEGFEIISNEKAKTEAEYREIDRQHWAKAREEFAAAKAA